MYHSQVKLSKLSILAACLLLIVSCGKKQEGTRVSLGGWSPEVKTAINDFLDLYGQGGKYHDGSEYVVFDFDNTTAIFDIQYQMMPYQLGLMAFKTEPDNLMDALSNGLVNNDIYAAQMEQVSRDYRSLYSKYGPFSAEGIAPADTATLHKDEVWLDFATRMYALFRSVSDHEDATTGTLWPLRWFDGFTDDELYDLSYRSHIYGKDRPTSEVTWRNAEGIEYTWTSGASVTDELKELWKALRDNGIDVWVCSGSQLQQVRAAVDAYGLHEYCTGMLAMSTTPDEDAGYIALPGGEWRRDDTPMRGHSWEAGKVDVINNVLVPRYGHGPIAGFMDSAGDFHFCTEYKSLKLVICFNRAERAANDGGGLIAETAIYSRDVLGYDLRKANAAGDTYYVLQGRDENGTRSLVPCDSTIRLGATSKQLFKNQANLDSLESFKARKMSVGEIVNTGAAFVPGFTSYHSID